MSNVDESESYRAWKEVLIEIFGETTTEILEKKVKENLSKRKSGLVEIDAVRADG